MSTGALHPAAVPSEAERFGLLVPGQLGLMKWLMPPAVVACLVDWIADGPYERIPAILTGLGTLVFFGWIVWKAQQSERPENNFVQLGEDGMVIQRYGRTWLKVRYAEMLAVRPVARVSLLQRWLLMIWKKDLAGYRKIELSRPRWFAHWWFPWWWRNVVLRLAQPTQFEVTLGARLDRFRKGAGGSSPVG